MMEATMEEKHGRTSFFDGSLLGLIGWSLFAIIVTVFTLGICKKYGWKINHTVIDGHRMYFDGKGIELFGNWIKWLILIIITLGIYSFWVGLRLEDWKAKHTSFIN